MKKGLKVKGYPQYWNDCVKGTPWSAVPAKIGPNKTLFFIHYFDGEVTLDADVCMEKIESPNVFTEQFVRQLTKAPPNVDVRPAVYAMKQYWRQRIYPKLKGVEEIKI